MKKFINDCEIICELPIPTADGVFTAHYSATGLAGLNFPRASACAAAQKEIPAGVRGWHRATGSALKSVLAGKSPRQFPPFDLTDGTEFQQSVWCELQKISLGQTKSYGEIARLIRKPKAVRAVGGACGANPVPVLIPCHRVLAANGKLGGFSGGLDWKRKLLAREKIIF
jgi:O-6-methylguanine DNA methyltransferase